jgi:hypothetical protein
MTTSKHAKANLTDELTFVALTAITRANLYRLLECGHLRYPTLRCVREGCRCWAGGRGDFILRDVPGQAGHLRETSTRSAASWIYGAGEDQSIGRGGDWAAHRIRGVAAIPGGPDEGSDLVRADKFVTGDGFAPSERLREVRRDGEIRSADCNDAVPNFLLKARHIRAGHGTSSAGVVHVHIGIDYAFHLQSLAAVFVPNPKNHQAARADGIIKCGHSNRGRGNSIAQKPIFKLTERDGGKIVSSLDDVAIAVAWR